MYDCVKSMRYLTKYKILASINIRKKKIQKSAKVIWISKYKNKYINLKICVQWNCLMQYNNYLFSGIKTTDTDLTTYKTLFND